MKHELSDFVDNHFRAEFESGRKAKGYEAALFCIANDVPIPDWLKLTVEAALKHDMMCPEGRGKGKTYPLSESASAVDRNFIVSEVERLSRSAIPKVQAFQMIALDLDKHRSKPWTTEMVKSVYYKNR